MILIRQLYQRTVEAVIGIGLLCWGVSMGRLDMPLHRMQFYSSLADMMGMIADPRTGYAVAGISCGGAFGISAAMDWHVFRRSSATFVASIWFLIGLGLWRDSGPVPVPGVFAYWTLSLITMITALGIPAAPRRN